MTNTAVENKNKQSPLAAKEISLTAGQLPKYADLGILVASIALGFAIVSLLSGALRPVGSIVLGALLFYIASYLISFSIEGGRRAANRLARYVIFSAFLLALIPLVWVLWSTIAKGYARFDLAYFTSTMRNVIGEGGGAAHAIVGTIIVTSLATLISVPIGLFTAIYLVEYGRGILKSGITFLVDVMTGIPSIVAGLFSYALFSVLFGASKSGIAGAVALSVLMIPYVVRNSEEILMLVPDKLREASYALGVTKWRTIVKVVLPTSISGIISGIILAIARIMGETAPLLVTMGVTNSMNLNPFPSLDRPVNQMTALPVLVYNQYMHPGINYQPSYDRSWTGALILVLFVTLLNLVGRWVSKRFAPKINR